MKQIEEFLAIFQTISLLIYIALPILAITIGFRLLSNWILRKKSNKRYKNPTPRNEEVNISEDIPIDYRNSYQAKYLLSRNEWHEYKKLKQYAESKGLQVFPKVRLLDIIEPRRGEQHYKSLFYKIQAKHIDFLICDQNAYIKAIVELDDNSHNQTDRQERDEFVDQVLTSVGYTVIRTRSITEETLANI